MADEEPQEKTPAQIETEKREYWKKFFDTGLNYSTTSAVVFVGLIYGTNVLNDPPHVANVLAIGNVITFMCFFMALFFKVGGEMYAGLSVVGSCGQNAMIAFTIYHLLFPKEKGIEWASGAAAFFTLIGHVLANWDILRDNVTWANFEAWIMGMYQGWLPNIPIIHAE